MTPPRRLIVAAALATALLAAAPSSARTRESCTVTRVSDVGPRLEGVADSGSTIRYDDGRRQTSYLVVAPVQASRRGDKVRLCLVSRPANCPPGDARGAVYAATNLRTGSRWQLADSAHLCGGT